MEFTSARNHNVLGIQFGFEYEASIFLNDAMIPGTSNRRSIPAPRIVRTPSSRYLVLYNDLYAVCHLGAQKQRLR
jgi:hypothetical protein